MSSALPSLSVVPQESSTRVSPSRVSPTRVSRKSAPHGFCTKVSHKSVPFKSVLQECPTRLPHKSECLTRVLHKSVPQEFCTRVSHKSECRARMSHKRFPQEYPTRVANKRAPQECQPICGRLFSSACAHSVCVVHLVSLPNLMVVVLVPEEGLRTRTPEHTAMFIAQLPCSHLFSGISIVFFMVRQMT